MERENWLPLVGARIGRLNPQPRHVPWPGIEQVTFHFVGQHPTHWATPVRADAVFNGNLTLR